MVKFSRKTTVWIQLTGPSTETETACTKAGFRAQNRNGAQTKGRLMARIIANRRVDFPPNLLHDCSYLSVNYLEKSTGLLEHNRIVQ